jgi:hypothetical protein
LQLTSGLPGYSLSDEVEPCLAVNPANPKNMVGTNRQYAAAVRAEWHRPDLVAVVEFAELLPGGGLPTDARTTRSPAALPTPKSPMTNAS